MLNNDLYGKADNTKAMKSGDMMEKSEILRNYLNAYWLRPETAMWRAVDVESMKNFKFESPSLDLGCGDGTFSFLRAGGEFEDDFDVFTVKNLDAFFDDVDVYDAYVEKTVRIKNKAFYKIDVGLDHKDTLMKKAEKLEFYNTFVVADANEKFPFEDNTFASVFSNIVYWLNNPKHVFSEIYRILKKNGQCCVMLPGPQFIESSFYKRFWGEQEFDFLKLIDRGRFSDNIKLVKTKNEWDSIIESSGFEILECVPHISATLMQIWDIGLRPIFPMLKRLVDATDVEVRKSVKRDWVDLFEKIMRAIVYNEDVLTQEKEMCFYCYILEKK